jgi:hypothetical protein
MVGKVRTTTLVAKIRQRILPSGHPHALTHMGKIDALRQVWKENTYIITLSLNKKLSRKFLKQINQEY